MKLSFRKVAPAETAPAGPKPTAGAMIDPRTLMRIKSLEMRARIVVQGFLSGLHRSPHHGFSVEFSEYRQYTPGDDPRYLDWRLFARSDRYYLKRFEDETNLRCHLLVDQSRSMGYGSLDYTKADYARTAAATLAYFLATQRDAVGVLTFDQAVADYVPPRYRPGHLHRLMVCLERAVAGSSTDLSAPLEQIAATVRKRGLIVLLSDLLTDPAVLGPRLGLLRSQGHEVVILRVLDPAEVAFDFAAPKLFVDLESAKNLYIDPAAARAQYQERFARHADAVGRICREMGIGLHTFQTSQPLELALFDFLNERSRGSRGAATRGGRRNAAAGAEGGAA